MPLCEERIPHLQSQSELQPVIDRDHLTIAEARKILERHAREGIDCPLCDTLYKTYKRSLNASIAASLVWLRAYSRKLTGSDTEFPFVEPQRVGPRHVVASREYPKARWWGMIEQRAQDKQLAEALESSAVSSGESAQIAGFWRLTQRGADFVDGRLMVDSHALVLKNNAMILTPEIRAEEGITQISVREALGKKFNFEELMNA